MCLLQIYHWVCQRKKFWKSVNSRGSYGQEFTVLFYLTRGVVVLVNKLLHNFSHCKSFRRLFTHINWQNFLLKKWIRQLKLCKYKQSDIQITDSREQSTEHTHQFCREWPACFRHNSWHHANHSDTVSKISNHTAQQHKQFRSTSDRLTMHHTSTIKLLCSMTLYRSQWPGVSTTDYSVRGPRFKPYRGRLCL